jgi:hypothetical protein
MIIPGGDAPFESIPEPTLPPKSGQVSLTLAPRTRDQVRPHHGNNLDLVRYHESGLTQQRYPFLTIPIITSTTSTGRQLYTTYPHLGSTRHRRVRKNNVDLVVGRPYRG